MSLQTRVSSQMWMAIRVPYESSEYSHAILEAVHLITNALRERAGVDGDGVALVGQALGGDNPKIRLNRLVTESERNIQKGVADILRGMYTAIRNPRSHDAIEDSQPVADAVIGFIDHLLGLIGESTGAFTLESFWERVADKDFVDNQRYAELLVAEIPPLRLSDALIHILQNRLAVDLLKRRHLIRHLMLQMNESQLATYFATVSTVFRTATDDASIRTALQMIKAEQWQRVAEAARLRIEQKLLKGIADGEVLRGGRGNTTQPLATWARDFLQYFTNRGQAAAILLRKLADTDPDDRAYVARYFLSVLPNIMEDEPSRDRAVQLIAQAIRQGDQEMRSKVIERITYFPAEWQRGLASELQDLTDPANPAVVLNDSTPFLAAPSAPEGTEVFDDDIPF